MGFLKINISGGTSDRVTIRIDGHSFSWMEDGTILKIGEGTHCFELSNDGFLRYSLTQFIGGDDLISFSVIAGDDGKIIGEPRHIIKTLDAAELDELNLDFERAQKEKAEAVARAAAKKAERQKEILPKLLLCLWLGIFGAHKFYRKQIGMGILYLFTLGLFGIGVIVDLIKIIIRINNSKEET